MQGMGRNFIDPEQRAALVGPMPCKQGQPAEQQRYGLAWGRGVMGHLAGIAARGRARARVQDRTCTHVSSFFSFRHRIQRLYGSNSLREALAGPLLT